MLDEYEKNEALRDSFAMAALTGLIGNCNVEGWDNFAKQAYLLADAMMEERRKWSK